MNDGTPAAIGAATRRLPLGAVIVGAPDAPLIQASLADLACGGRPVVTILPDVPGVARLACDGSDHLARGRAGKRGVMGGRRQT
ncbi:type 1 periplasmic-binding domain-containing protein [Tabrizicola caldifontis]|uniref:hypothetical protein n=1 Tax=Tabrizicola caldifontis TaxID=2528036 RepID=UPI0010810FC5|nr:hypothetical protein [Rhodobacter sp. YIM 73028]